MQWRSALSYVIIIANRKYTLEVDVADLLFLDCNLTPFSPKWSQTGIWVKRVFEIQLKEHKKHRTYFGLR